MGVHWFWNLVTVGSCLHFQGAFLFSVAGFVVLHLVYCMSKGTAEQPSPPDVLQ